MIMIEKLVNSRYLFFCIFVPQIILAATKSDFDLAKQAFNQGNYKIAQVYFDCLLQEEPLGKYTPDATYYLIKICDKDHDFINFLAYAERFLADYRYDLRGAEIYEMLMQRLLENDALVMACAYMKKYDYRPVDFSILEKIGNGLLKQDRQALADSIFSICPQTDTIKILRAQLQTEQKLKEDMFRSITGVKGKIYLAEHYLGIGDTINAYEIYQQIPKGEVSNDLLYRFAKIVVLFNNHDTNEFTKRLAKIRGFSNKAALLEALAVGQLHNTIKPIDEEEMRLLIQIHQCDSVSTAPPESISFDSLWSDTTNLINKIVLLRKTFKNNYYLDSLYSHILLGSNRIKEANEIMQPYLVYFNVRNYVRRIRSLNYFRQGDYKSAMNDIILLDDRSSSMIYLLAECVKHIGQNPSDLYEEVMDLTNDSTLYYQALKGFIESEFADRNYEKIITYNIEDFQNDTSLIKIYLRSLVRTGKKEKADSIFIQFFVDRDYDLVNDYGEFLINQKEYTKAEDFYDFHVHARYDVPQKFYYNWALVPFMQGKLDTALVRFTIYIDNFKGSENRANSFFKIATINYLQGNYDTAGYYYELASEDSSLQYDALQNQLICYKKAEDWQKVVETGTQILIFVSEDSSSDARFEMGYAFLRAGNIRDAIDNLKVAVRLKPIPGHYYWLGEAYLTKGDFLRSLYHYQKIVDLFPKDEMWSPTAQYKTGIVLEFMAEYDAAKKVYKDMIRKRGVGDTWGAEAQKRLEVLENVK